MIKTLEINNYKSIDHVKLECKRINLFIGKPNVGKSNILEALLLFQNDYPSNIRFQNLRNLFLDQNLNNPIVVSLDDKKLHLKYWNKYRTYIAHALQLKGSHSVGFVNNILEKEVKALQGKGARRTELQLGSRDVDIQGKITDAFELNNFVYPSIKKFSFKKNNNAEVSHQESNELLAPFGENIFEVLKHDKELLKEVSSLFSEYGYSLIIDYVTNKAEIQKIIDNISYKVPYTLMADTLQRVIFYLVAIKKSNAEAILLEEPENNSFPPYIRKIAFEIAYSEKQFFIATHSPYLFNTLISEGKRDDIAVHIVSLDDYKTKIKTMTPEQLSDLSNHGIDVFFNLDLFAE